MATYHPDDQLVLEYAAGQLANPLGLLLACHIEQCPKCSAKAKRYETLGGELMEDIEPQAVSADLLSRIMGHLDEPLPVKKRVAAPEGVPRPLARFVPQGFDDLAWKGITSVKSVILPLEDQQYKAELYRIPAGKVLPQHTHDGNEYTYVMQGSFADKDGEYLAGDFVTADGSVNHKPVATGTVDCICLAVTDAPLKMTGTFSRMLNPFIR